MYDIDKIKNDLKDSLSDYRYEHSLLVAKEAKNLAVHYEIDKDKAYLAGLVHDIAKEFSNEENIKWIKKGKLSKDLLSDENIKIAHSYVGAIVVKEIYNLDDEICSAVKYHTVGNLKMNLLDKIIFIADKIGRKDTSDFIEELKEKAYKNIDEAMLFFFIHQQEKFEKKGKKLHTDTLEFIKYLNAVLINSDENNNSLKYWENEYIEFTKEDIKTDDWLDKFKEIILQCSTPIIDLGCGRGNDALYLIKNKKNVICCDMSSNAIKNIKKIFPEIYDTKCFNMLQGLPFESNSCELIIADLCLHYFKSNDTFNIINEIYRVLRKGGNLIFRVNSINDINYGAGQGKEVEHHLYLTSDNRLKRFFNEEDICSFFSSFEINYLTEESTIRRDGEKILYTVCVKKN